MSSKIVSVTFLLIFLFSFLKVSAQEAEMVEDNWLSSAVSLGIIIGFIVILLWLGGVIKIRIGSKVGLSFLLFLIIIILSFVIPQIIPYPTFLEIPPDLMVVPLPKYAAQALIMMGLPQEWMYFPAIIYLFILPFAGIYTIVWAFLSSIRIFEGLPSNINKVIALVITFLTIPTGWFIRIVWVIFSFIGVWSVVIFALIFLAVSFFRGYAFLKREKLESETKWNIEAKQHLDRALKYIEEKQDDSARRELEQAYAFKGFRNEYYQLLTTAINSLVQGEPNREAAKEAIKKAKEYL